MTQIPQQKPYQIFCVIWHSDFPAWAQVKIFMVVTRKMVKNVQKTIFIFLVPPNCIYRTISRKNRMTKISAYENTD